MNEHEEIADRGSKGRVGHRASDSAGSSAPVPPSAMLSRRRFLQALGLGVAVANLPFRQLTQAAAAAGVATEDLVLVPADKGLDPDWIKSLYTRGAATVLSGNQLTYVGLPIGGVTCGQVYLGGDGRLWRWDVDNRTQGTGDGHYASPVQPSSPFDLGLVLRTTALGQTHTRYLDGRGFDTVKFSGRYPIGQVSLSQTDLPVSVTLNAYTPYAPLKTTDSSSPVVVLEYSLTNHAGEDVHAELGVYAENPVVLGSRMERPVKLSAREISGTGYRGLQFEAAESVDTTGRPDILVEDWSDGTYNGWTAQGDAFGDRPVSVSEIPSYATGVNPTGQYLVFSHNPRIGDPTDPNVSGLRDNLTGKMTSDPFVLQRKGLAIRVGGGNYPGKTCVNVLVGGKVVASASGASSNTMVERVLDLSAYEGQQAVLDIVDDGTGSFGYVSVDRIVQTDLVDVLFEDWEKTTYEGWTVEGTAFGSGPILVSDIPSYQGDVNAVGLRCVNSHASAPGSSVEEKDAATGKLTSSPFTISHRYIRFRLGGGDHPGQTCLNVVVDGKVVATATGPNNNRMQDRTLNVAAWRGKSAVIEIVDNVTGGWGNIGVDQIVFSDRSLDSRPFGDLPDHGSFALAVTPPTNNGQPAIGDDWLDLSIVGGVRPSIADWSTPSAVLDSGAGADSADGVSGTIAGCVSIKLNLRPQETQTVRVLTGWFFPVPDRAALGFLRDAATLKRHYVNRYDSAAKAIDTVVGGLAEHERVAKLWTKTWYDDSTLPWWLLERVATTMATLATSTVYRFADGRFYGWEGVSCCAGTCTHVYHYAQAAARIFPELERDTRERVDLGIGYHQDTGEIGMRAEANMSWATDGQCGTILRIYREHQMTSDGAWLQEVWPRVRKAVEFVIAHDLGPDGVVDGGQPNTLDATWYGRISWISSMYVAALRAAEAMANEVGDTAFAKTCASLAESGSTIIARDLFNGEYFIHEPDPNHPGTVNTNRGCFIDQILGQSWAHQVHLPRVLPQDKSATALESLWKYNFCPRPIDYRSNSPIKGGRTYYDADTPALLMCTWPMGGADEAGSNWSLGYFNEAMNGFEYQAASNMIAEGLVEHGLAVTRAIHDRYRPDRRNPYNEIECGDHYARSMAGYGVYVNVLGYEYHGPKAHLGFAPKIQQDDFAAAFTAAEGWGRYRQQRTDSQQTSSIEARFGSIKVATLRLDVPGSGTDVRADVDGTAVAATAARDADGRLVVTLTTPVVLKEGQSLTVSA